MKEVGVGRVFLLSCPGSLDGNGITPEEVVKHALKSGAKFLILDATQTSYVNTPGVRWLIQLRNLLDAVGKRLRIVSKAPSRVSRSLEMLHVDIDRYDNMAGAWKTPWMAEYAPRKRSRKRAA